MIGATLAGTISGQHYIFSTDAAETSSIDLLGIEGLPIIKNKAGVVIPNLFSATKKGSMDVTRFGHYCEQVMSSYGTTLGKEWIFDPVTKALIQGPVVLQVDSGPGRFADSDENFEIRESTADRGLGIYAGLPNGTSAMQLMDGLFGFFKQQIRHNSFRIVMEQLKERDAARLAGNQAIPSISLGRHHMGKLITGVGIKDGLGLRAFETAFTPERILAAGRKTGLDGSNAFLKHPRMIDDTECGKSEARILNEKHNDSLQYLIDLKVGFKVAELKVGYPPMESNFTVPTEKELFIQAMIDNGSIYKAGTIFKWCNTMSVNQGLIMEVHRKARSDAKLAEKEKGEKKEDEIKEREKLGMVVFMKFKHWPKALAETSHSAGEAETLCRFILTTPGHTSKALKDYKSKTDTTKFLLETDWRILFDKNFDEAKVAAEHQAAAATAASAAPAPPARAWAAAARAVAGAVLAPGALAVAAPIVAAPGAVAPGVDAPVIAVEGVDAPVIAVLAAAAPAEAAPAAAAPFMVAPVAAAHLGAVPALVVPNAAAPVVRGFNPPRQVLAARKRPVELTDIQEQEAARYSKSGSRSRGGRGR
jgi:hypothetical protein